MTKEQLRESLLTAPITDFEAHIKRGGMIVVVAECDLVTVAFAMASNNQLVIGDLLDRKLIYKAALGDFETWLKEKTFFNFVIVQPFVIAQKFVSLAQIPNSSKPSA